MRLARVLALLSGSLLLCFLPACGASTQPDSAPKPMPGFQLVDVNPASATYQRTLSPGYFKGQVSAWYFGHST